MAPKRQRRSIFKSPMSGSFRTPKKAKKTIAGESPAFQQIVNQQLEAMLPEIVNHVSAQMGNATHQGGAGAGGSGSNGCTYKEFAACKPKEFDGKGGAISLTRWVEKMEQVMDISGCTEGQKVKYAASSLVNKALTWWNTQIQARGRIAAMSMTWEDLKALMVEEFCPSNEMQKLEEELWNHTMVGANHAGYTDRFHELARMVPHLVTPESKRIDRYIRGLVPQIRAMVRATEPTTLLSAIQKAGALNLQSQNYKNDLQWLIRLSQNRVMALMRKTCARENAWSNDLNIRLNYKVLGHFAHHKIK
ncbi:reverse transcriptase domain-containing protein [Artemisia annua]|uniref:Reverse transcriptase domain-containing protein n=1 Tax=Artemisia annua TaxID=35608 RepID=A0A2U1MM98_ARTAN|nr:reverse transcriptase domain-containing protein [Artemisia annua]